MRRKYNPFNYDQQEGKDKAVPYNLLINNFYLLSKINTLIQTQELIAIIISTT